MSITQYTLAIAAAFALVATPVTAQDKPAAGQADKKVETATIALEVKGMT